MRDVPPTPAATLTRARRIALGNGLRYVYTGNVHDPAGGTTRCSGCGAAVIVRDWYAIRSYRLTDGGVCAGCGTRLAGVYDGPCGVLGLRCQILAGVPVRRRVPDLGREHPVPGAVGRLDADHPDREPAPVELVVLVRPHGRSIAAAAPAATRVSLTA